MVTAQYPIIPSLQFRLIFFLSTIKLTYDFTGQRSTINLSYLLEKLPDIQYKDVFVNLSVDITYYVLDYN